MVMNQQQLRKLYDELVADIFTKPDQLKSIVDNQLARREGWKTRKDSILIKPLVYLSYMLSHLSSTGRLMRFAKSVRRF